MTGEQETGNRVEGRAWHSESRKLSESEKGRKLQDSKFGISGSDGWWLDAEEDAGREAWRAVQQGRGMPVEHRG